MKLLLYCTKSKPYLYRISDITSCAWFTSHEKINNENGFNGKIVGECELKTLPFELSKNVDDNNKTFFEFLVMKHSCLTYQELKDYLQGKCGYAIYIKNLKIYDKPRELSLCNFGIEKAPQNMCYATKRIINTINVRYAYPNGKIVKPSVEINSFEKCVLISIRPEWLCKILNGEKTIEVRKKVLKDML